MKAHDSVVIFLLSILLLAFGCVSPCIADGNPSSEDTYWASSNSQDQSITVGISGSSNSYESSVPGSFAEWGTSSGSGPSASLTDSGTEAKPSEIPMQCFGQRMNEIVTPFEQCLAVAGPAQETDDGVGNGAPDRQFVPPSTLSVLYRGLASVRISAPGLVVQPAGASYIGIPTIVSAGRTKQTLRASVLGRTVWIHLTADSYSFDFGDGSAPLVTTDPGGRYPDMTNHHTYFETASSRAITLTTTWSATTTNPFTGETLTVNGIVQSSETSAPFEVRDSHTVITDLAEETAGH